MSGWFKETPESLAMLDEERAKLALDQARYVDIGPECFALADGSVLCWRGENYVPQKPSPRVRWHNWRIRKSY